MPRWEYLVIQEHHHSAVVLNRLGADGWELVGFDRNTAVLKRPIEAAPAALENAA